MINSSLFKTVSIGIVAEDKIYNSKTIKAYLSEQLSSIDDKLNNVVNTNVQTKDSMGNAHNINIDNSYTITAIWYNPDSNRVTPPDVRKGEKVRIYQYGNTDKYYWRTMTNELDLRGLEHVEHIYVNEPDLKESTDNNVYKTIVSTRNKMITTRTADNNGEATTYLKELDTKNGIDILVRDGFGNEIVLTSKDGTLTITTNLNVVVNTTHATVNASETTDINTGTFTVKSNLTSINP